MPSSALTARRERSRPGCGGGPQLLANPELDLSIAVTATVVLTVAGALAGLAPARVAVAIHPVAALAHE